MFISLRGGEERGEKAKYGILMALSRLSSVFHSPYWFPHARSCQLNERAWNRLDLEQCLLACEEAKSEQPRPQGFSLKKWVKSPGDEVGGARRDGCLFLSSRACHSAGEMPRSTRLAHKAPVMQASIRRLSVYQQPHEIKVSKYKSVVYHLSFGIFFNFVPFLFN